MFKLNVIDPYHQPVSNLPDQTPDVSASNFIPQYEMQVNFENNTIAQQDKQKSNRSLQSNENKFNNCVDQHERTLTHAPNEKQSKILNLRKIILISYLEDCPLDKRIAKAVRHFNDAILLREPRTDIDLYNNKYILLIYLIFTDPLWHYFMIYISILFVSQVFIEPANSIDTITIISDQTIKYLISQESIILFCYLIDTLASFLEKPQPENKVRKTQKFHQLRIIIGRINWKFILKLFFLIVNFVDYIYFFSSYPNSALRFSRIIRPIWIAFYSTDVKDTLFSIILAFKNVLDLIAFYFILALFWAYLGYNLLSDVSSFYFQNYFYSFLSIYASYSFDSYPDMMIDAINSSYLYLLYFIPFFSINLWFLMPLPTAIIFHAYKSKRAIMVIHNKLIVQEALIYCFMCLDIENKGYLTYSEFRDFFSQVYKGRLIEQNIERMWKGMDVDGNNQMQVDEFVDIIYILQYWPRVYEQSTEEWDKLRNWILHYFKLDKIVHSNSYLYFIITVVIINTICIIIYAFTDPNDTTVINNLATLDTVFNSIYITDCCIKMIGYGLENFFNDPWCKFDFIMLFITIISMIGIEYLRFMKKTKSSKILKLVRIEKVLRILRSLRGVKLFQYLEYGAQRIKKIKILFQKISLTFPIALRILLSIFFFFYVFAIIGMQIFDTDTNSYNDAESPFETQNYVNFNSFPSALLILFQVCVESTWINQMFNIGFQYNIYGSFFFFCSFYLITVFFLASLLKGLIWEGFYIVDQTFEEHQEVIEKLEEEQDKHLHEEHSHKKSGLILKEKQFCKIFDKYKIGKFVTDKLDSGEIIYRRAWSIEAENKGQFFHYPYQTIITKIQIKKHKAVQNMKKVQKAVRNSLKVFTQSLSKKLGTSQGTNDEIMTEQEKYEILKTQFKKRIMLFHEHHPKDIFINVKQVPVKYLNEPNQQFDTLGLSVYCFNEKGVAFHTDKVKESLNQISESSIKSKQKIESNQKKKQQMIDVGALNSQGQLMEKTVLKDFDNSAFDHMKNTFMNEIYGTQKKFYISAAALNLSNIELMRIKHCLRYQEISYEFVFKQLYKFEKNISRTIMQGLGGIRFLFEIKNQWFYIEKQEGQYSLHLIKNMGIWNFTKELLTHESLIYKADNILNLNVHEDDENLSTLDKIYTKFTNQLTGIFQLFKPYLIEDMFIDEEHILFMSQIYNHRQEEIIEEIQLQLKMTNVISPEEVVTRILTVGLYEIPKENVSQPSSLRKKTHAVMLQEINSNRNDDVHDLEKTEDFFISLFAFMEFFKDIRDVVYNYQTNFFHNAQCLKSDIRNIKIEKSES